MLDTTGTQISQTTVPSSQYSLSVIPVASSYGAYGSGVTSTSYNPGDLVGLILSFKSNAFSNYMRAPDNSGNNIDSATSVGPWEKWTLVKNSDNSYSFKSTFGWYLSVRSGGAYAQVQ